MLPLRTLVERCVVTGSSLFTLSYPQHVHIATAWDNGRFAFLGEHACTDGTPTLRLNEFILDTLAAKEFSHRPWRTITEPLAHSSRRNRLDGQRANESMSLSKCFSAAFMRSREDF